MYKRTFLILVISLGLLSIAAISSALTIDVTVTPAYIVENPHTFSVKAERRNDGLIHFTITYQLSRPTYLVMNSDISADGHIRFQSTSSFACNDNSATYQLAISPASLAETHFELFAGTFVKTDGHTEAIPGGIAYKIQLAEFAKSATTPKSEFKLKD